MRDSFFASNASAQDPPARENDSAADASSVGRRTQALSEPSDEPPPDPTNNGLVRLPAGVQFEPLADESAGTKGGFLIGQHRSELGRIDLDVDPEPVVRLTNKRRARPAISPLVKFAIGLAVGLLVYVVVVLVGVAG